MFIYYLKKSTIRELEFFNIVSPLPVLVSSTLRTIFILKFYILLCIKLLQQTIDEFATRVGQQAVVLVATPGKPNSSYKVFGAKPLEDVVKNLKTVIMEELENALAQQAPPPLQEDPTLYELPPLIIDGIPTPVEKMTQAQLRAFIPLMLKYSTGRGKPGWGRDSTRPPWWPKELPWANVRMDARSEDEKQKVRKNRYKNNVRNFDSLCMISL